MASVEAVSAGFSELDFLNDDELDQIMSSIKTPTLPDEKAKVQCPLCPKLCASDRGLKRHTKNQHPETLPETDTTSSTSSSSSTVKKSAEDILHPTVFKKILDKCFEKLFNDKCYPESVRSCFNKDNLSDHSSSSVCYELVTMLKSTAE